MLKQEMICTIGRHDIPIIQEQPDFVIDLLKTNILLFGSAMSGKTNLLRLLITILHKLYRENDEQIFILDFGGALAEFERLPLVAAYFDNANEEYVKRVFNLMEEQLKNNISILKGKNYNACTENQPIHTTLLIDNVNAFLEEPRYSGYQEKLAKLCRDGLSKGITIVMTAGSTKGLASYMGSFKQKIALDMPSESYADIFNNKIIPVGGNPGHGYANVTYVSPNMNVTFPTQNAYEMQLNISDSISDDDFNRNLDWYFGERQVKKYKRFPDILTEYEFYRFVEDDKEYFYELDTPNIAVGLDYTECKPYVIDYNIYKVIAVYGKKEFGKTNLLKRLLKNLLNDDRYTFVFFDDGREQLKDNIADSVMDNSRNVYINGYEEVYIKNKTGTLQSMKFSPMQLFIKLIHERYMDLTGIRRMSTLVTNDIFGTGVVIDSHAGIDNNNVVFVLQSKFLYVNSVAAKIFMEIILPTMAAQAEEKNWIFIFTDVKSISDADNRDNFNSTIEMAFLLDNIAEFVSERGQKSVFGSMDVKSLKEEYARCEIGDGYVYSIEKDDLKKLKIIKEDEG